MVQLQYDLEEEEYYGEDEFDLSHCDCLDPDIDLLLGSAKCWTCGRSWMLTAKEMEAHHDAEIEYHRWQDRENHIEHSRHPYYAAIRLTRWVKAFFARNKCCGQRFRCKPDCDEIPF